MGASITVAGESLIAQKQASQQILDVQRFIFANVPGLDPSGPVDRAAGKPAADRIVYSAEILDTNAGFVNPNQVVYSLQVGSDVGDWDFNWIGLESAEGVLFAVAYVPMQQKRRNIPPLQLGNNITRNFLVVYDGAQALTGITIDARTWQHDFTVRLAGIDERERLSNRDVFGRACFFGSSFQVEKVGNAYQVKSGTAYIEGIRVQRGAALVIAPPALPTTAWLDVALQRELSDVVASWSVVFGTDLVDRTDSVGVRHYLVPIADLASAASLVDRRPVEAIAGPLVGHFAARAGDYPALRARATTKADVGLDQIPNAISDDPETNSSLVLATTKAVKVAAAALWTALANVISGATIVGRATKLAIARTISVTGSVTGSVTFDGSDNVTLNLTAPQSTETVAGAARVATQPQADAGTDDSAYITPKKMRWGFSSSLTANGYLEFPTWLGGLLFNWGSAALGPEGSESLNITYPKAYGSFCRVLPHLWFTGSRIENSNSAQIRDRTLTGFKLDNQWTNNGSNLSGTVDWFSVGK